MLQRTLAAIVVVVLMLAGISRAHAQAITEGFDNISTLPGSGWVQTNNSQPVGSIGYFQGNASVFSAQAGAVGAYLGANFNSGGGTSTISNWMMLPTRTLSNGDTFSFYTRTVDSPAFADRLQVRMSLNGSSTDVGATATSLGVFTSLLLDIDPTYTAANYPSDWTQYTLTLSGIATPTDGRLAFRYFVEDGGPLGDLSDYIGIDTVNYTPSAAAPAAVPLPAAVWPGLATLAALALVARQRKNALVKN